jgi:hypothetical protein
MEAGAEGPTRLSPRLPHDRMNETGFAGFARSPRRSGLNPPRLRVKS